MVLPENSDAYSFGIAAPVLSVSNWIVLVEENEKDVLDEVQVDNISEEEATA